MTFMTLFAPDEVTRLSGIGHAGAPRTTMVIVDGWPLSVTRRGDWHCGNANSTWLGDDVTVSGRRRGDRHRDRRDATPSRQSAAADLQQMKAILENQVSPDRRWDKPLSSIIGLWGMLVVWIVAGLNVRFGWPPPVPIGWQVLGAILFVLSTLFGTWAMLENRFFSAVVRIQTDRGHTVVTTGPYRFVRHPGYAAGIFGYLAMPLLLDSLWAFIPALLTIVLIIVRTKLEDETLQAELPGYVEYAQHTRSRLLPGVW